MNRSILPEHVTISTLSDTGVDTIKWELEQSLYICCMKENVEEEMEEVGIEVEEGKDGGGFSEEGREKTED